MKHLPKIRIRFFLVVTLVVWISNVGQVQPQPVVIDGAFSDWAARAPLYTDPTGDNNGSPIDFGCFWAGNDNRFLFMAVEVGKPIVLQSDNAISLYIDTDNNPQTGQKINGIGADLQWTFGQRNGFYYVNGALQAIFHNDIGLVSAPTVSSSQFELALDRTAQLAGRPVFSSDTLHIVFSNAGGDRLPDAGSVVTYIFGEDAQPPLPVLSIRRKTQADFRALAYNVLHDGLFDPQRASAFERILQALQPDVIGFEEIYEHTAAEVAARLNGWLPLSNNKSWYAAKVNPDVLTVSRFPILQTATLDGNGAFLLDLSSIGKGKLLFIVAHPPCCKKDDKRQREIDHIMAFIRDAEAGTASIALPRGTPILIAGDMNLVGKAQQLRTFLTGQIVNTGLYGPSFHPDWDGTALADLSPRHPNWPLAFTWFNARSSYGPGRLDYMIFTDSVLKPLHDFVLFTPEMDTDSLQTFGLKSGDATLASDHLPVVCDFSIEPYTRVGSRTKPSCPKKFSLLPTYPNPFNPDTTIRLHVTRKMRARLSILNLKGRQVRLLAKRDFSPGEYRFHWNGTDDAGRPVSSGLYFCLVECESERQIQKMTFLR